MSHLVCRALVAVCALAFFPTFLVADTSPVMRVLSTPSGTKFGLFGAKPTAPAATLFVFATAMDEMGKRYDFTEAGRHLAKDGWLYVTLDPPCHGLDHRNDEPDGLTGWAYRIGTGEDFIAPFTRRCHDVLDFLIDQGYTDPLRVAASGTSRGGFCALHFAASDPRVRTVAAISPVTNLLALREFADIRKDQVCEFNIDQLGKDLSGHAVWLSIGSDDKRVGTDDCVAAARSLMQSRTGAAARSVELVVRPTDGHQAIDNAYALAANFVHRQTKKAVADRKDEAENSRNQRVRSCSSTIIWSFIEPAPSGSFTKQFAMPEVPSSPKQNRGNSQSAIAACIET